MLSAHALAFYIHGIIVSGEKGSGKTALIDELQRHFGPQIIFKRLSMTNSFLSIDWSFVDSDKPYAIVIDELEERTKEAELKVNSVFSRIKNTKGVLIGTCRSEYLSSWEKCLGPERFDFEVTIESIGRLWRHRILQSGFERLRLVFLENIAKEDGRDLQASRLVICRAFDELAREEVLDSLALKTSGFTIFDF